LNSGQCPIAGSHIASKGAAPQNPNWQKVTKHQEG